MDDTNRKTNMKTDWETGDGEAVNVRKTGAKIHGKADGK